MAAARNGASASAATPPDGKIRQSQLVTTFGPGAMVDLVDHAVLIGGLDFWSYDKSARRPVITSRACATRSPSALLAGIDRELALDDAFREPPEATTSEPTPRRGIQVLEFPRGSCARTGCRALVRARRARAARAAAIVHHCSRTQDVASACRSASSRLHARASRGLSVGLRSRIGTRKLRGAEPRLEEGATGDFSRDRGALRTAARASAAVDGAVKRGQPAVRRRSPVARRRGRRGVRASSCGCWCAPRATRYFAQVVSALSIPSPGRELAQARGQTVWESLEVTADAAEMLAASQDRRQVQAALAALRRRRRARGGRGAARGRAGRARSRCARRSSSSSWRSSDEAPGELPGRRD